MRWLSLGDVVVWAWALVVLAGLLLPAVNKADPPVFVHVALIVVIPAAVLALPVAIIGSLILGWRRWAGPPRTEQVEDYEDPLSDGNVGPIADDRPLTPTEERLIRWLLKHSTPEAAGFLPQLDRARVASRCPCGCATIDLAVNGVVPPPGAGMRVLADYGWRTADGNWNGVFVFACGGQLAGLEVWSMDGRTTAPALPAIADLTPRVIGPGSTPDRGPRTR